jgi:ceramide glucosyltransferase
VILSLLLLLPAAAYQTLAIVAGIRHLRLRNQKQDRSPATVGVSVLKPLRGLDPNTHEAFISQVEQDHPCFELLFGVSSADDPAAEAVRELQRSYPGRSIQLVITPPGAANGKVGVLTALAERARFPYLVVNDSDIKVCPDYLKSVTAPLSDGTIGLVTCPYRALGHNVPATWEALGVAVDFMPSTLVAPLVGVREFGLGSTLAFRATDLQALGGFRAIENYIADDYQLAKRITLLGKSVQLSSYVVETSFGDDSWQGVWQHQLRWARTIRTSKKGGYAGLPITHAGLWILLLLVVGAKRCALLLIVLRVASAYTTGVLVLSSTVALQFGWLAPVWDLFAVAVWFASYRNRTVQWRDRTLSIDAEGRIR